MTNKQLELRAALRKAFDAGSAYAIASHKDFVQIHEPREIVVDSLASQLELVVCPRAGRHKACLCCSHSQPHASVVDSPCRGRCDAARETLQCVPHNLALAINKEGEG